MDQHVETDGEISSDRKIGEAADEVRTFRATDRSPTYRLGRQVDPDIALHRQVSRCLTVATAHIDDRVRRKGLEDDGQHVAFAHEGLATAADSGSELGVREVAPLPEGGVRE